MEDMHKISPTTGRISQKRPALPARQRTFSFGGNTQQLRSRKPSVHDINMGIARVWEVLELGHADHPIRIGWIGWITSHDEFPDGLIFISQYHKNWTAYNPRWRDTMDHLDHVAFLVYAMYYCVIPRNI